MGWRRGQACAAPDLTAELASLGSRRSLAESTRRELIRVEVGVELLDVLGRELAFQDVVSTHLDIDQDDTCRVAELEAKVPVAQCASLTRTNLLGELAHLSHDGGRFGGVQEELLFAFLVLEALLVLLGNVGEDGLELSASSVVLVLHEHNQARHLVDFAACVLQCHDQLRLPREVGGRGVSHHRVGTGLVDHVEVLVEHDEGGDPPHAKARAK
mmetsp:Transcript_21869/g.69852  ORF Transcript_21869/g.69852 Transcript_21869/m.69852 type:complete len:214 (+) Transcript_21869:285-926(+)